MRPAGMALRPMCIWPRRNVPVVIITALQGTVVPSASLTPDTPGRASPERGMPSWSTRSSTPIACTVRFGYERSVRCICSRYRSLSICARGPHTAGPRLMFSTRNCTPAASHTLPQTPSRASISRMSVPLPMPPNEGLHDISPIVDILWVRSSVRAPVRAAPAAASDPACPPPTTTTS
eukprot:Opistho-2@42000